MYVQDLIGQMALRTSMPLSSVKYINERKLMTTPVKIINATTTHVLCAFPDGGEMILSKEFLDDAWVSAGALLDPDYSPTVNVILPMRVEDIKVTKAFKDTVPTPEKFAKCLSYYKEHQEFDRDIVLSESGYILDGYVAFCVARAIGLKTVSVIYPAELASSRETSKGA